MLIVSRAESPLLAGHLEDERALEHLRAALLLRMHVDGLPLRGWAG